MDPADIDRQIRKNWPVDTQALQVTPLQVGSGLSGARLWRIGGLRHDACLRQWPSTMSWERILQIHELQSFVTNHTTALVPRLLILRDGSTALLHGEHVWELAEWRFGDVVPLATTTADQALAAMQSLAEFHQLAQQFSIESGVLDSRPAPGLQHRAERVDALCRGQLAKALDELKRFGDKSARPLFRSAAEIVQAELPKLRCLLAESRDAHLPVQWCHGDARWENLLFQGNRVTGLIDLGAATVDSALRDVARLRGDLFGYGIVAPRQLLSAYESIRPLGDAELASLHLFEHSATPVAIANWLVWLAEPGPPLRQDVDRRTAALARLAALVARFTGKGTASERR